MAAGDIYHIAGGLKGNPALMCIGGDSDDYVQVNGHAAARVLAGDTKGTYTMWFNVADKTGTYTLIGNGDDNVVEFLEINIEAGSPVCRSTDNTTAQFVSTGDGDDIVAHRWHHLVVSQRADGSGVHMWLDGTEIEVEHGTDTDVDSWFAELAGLDTTRLGAANKAGDASVTQELKGALCDVRYYASALTDAEILKDKNRDEDLIEDATSSWALNGDYSDDGSDEVDGTAVGAVQLVDTYSPFTSKVRHSTGTPVVADDISISADNGTGYAVVVKAA